jgi:hypothetical protein
MLINVDKLWKPADEHPTDSGYHYCIAETESGCEFRQLLFFSIVHKCWEGVQTDTVKFWLSHLPSPGNNKFISIPSEVILEEDELAIVVVKPPEGEKGVDIAVLVETRDYRSAVLSHLPSNVKVWLRPYDSDQDVNLDTAAASFLKAKEQMDKEEELYKDD